MIELDPPLDVERSLDCRYCHLHLAQLQLQDDGHWENPFTVADSSLCNDETASSTRNYRLNAVNQQLLCHISKKQVTVRSIVPSLLRFDIDCLFMSYHNHNK